MLTQKQKRWIETLNNERKIAIFPYDPNTEKIFKRVKIKIQKALGKVVVEHKGASSLKISGQDEIDVYIPTKKEKFPVYIKSLEKIFGEVRKVYDDRARFEVKEDNKKIDLFLIDINHKNWKDSLKFHEYLKSHPKDLDRYRILKEEASGVSVREYYKRKIEFINSILKKRLRNN